MRCHLGTNSERLIQETMMGWGEGTPGKARCSWGTSPPFTAVFEPNLLFPNLGVFDGVKKLRKKLFHGPSKAHTPLDSFPRYVNWPELKLCPMFMKSNIHLSMMQSSDLPRSVSRVPVTIKPSYPHWQPLLPEETKSFALADGKRAVSVVCLVSSVSTHRAHDLVLCCWWWEGVISTFRSCLVLLHREFQPLIPVCFPFIGLRVAPFLPYHPPDTILICHASALQAGEIQENCGCQYST